VSEYEQALRAIEDKYGKIDNIKFLLDDDANLPLDDIKTEIARVATAHIDGSAPAESSFSDSSLKSEVISIS
jgi:hypothetical protein